LNSVKSDGRGEDHPAPQDGSWTYVKAALEKLSWKEESLTNVSKTHLVKVQFARLLRTEGIMSLKWIAARLQMGSWTNVANLLNQPAAELDFSSGDAAPETQPRKRARDADRQLHLCILPS